MVYLNTNPSRPRVGRRRPCKTKIKMKHAKPWTHSYRGVGLLVITGPCLSIRWVHCAILPTIVLMEKVRKALACNLQPASQCLMRTQAQFLTTTRSNRALTWAVLYKNASLRAIWTQLWVYNASIASSTLQAHNPRRRMERKTWWAWFEIWASTWTLMNREMRSFKLRHCRAVARVFTLCSLEWKQTLLTPTLRR